MKENAQLECTCYIPPKAVVISVNCQNILCQSGEVPDMNEGWKYEF